MKYLKRPANLHRRLVEAFYQTENMHCTMSHNKSKIKTTKYKKSLQSNHFSNIKSQSKRKKARY
jgi:hypothetical protein